MKKWVPISLLCALATPALAGEPTVPPNHDMIVFFGEAMGPSDRCFAGFENGTATRFMVEHIYQGPHIFEVMTISSTQDFEYVEGPPALFTVDSLRPS